MTMSTKKFGQQLQLLTRGLSVAPGPKRIYKGIAVVIRADVPGRAYAPSDEDDDAQPSDADLAAAY